MTECVLLTPIIVKLKSQQSAPVCWCSERDNGGTHLALERSRGKPEHIFSTEIIRTYWCRILHTSIQYQTSV